MTAQTVYGRRALVCPGCGEKHILDTERFRHSIEYYVGQEPRCPDFGSVNFVCRNSSCPRQGEIQALTCDNTTLVRVDRAAV
jgi:predicted RNA-binding Zn-ribbon protein involved in translation (DUF1610 family)